MDNNEYEILLTHNKDYDSTQDFHNDSKLIAKNNVNIIANEIKSVIRIFVKAILKFYNLPQMKPKDKRLTLV